MIFKVPSNPDCSIILWFYDKIAVTNHSFILIYLEIKYIFKVFLNKESTRSWSVYFKIMLYKPLFLDTGDCASMFRNLDAVSSLPEMDQTDTICHIWWGRHLLIVTNLTNIQKELEEKCWCITYIIAGKITTFRNIISDLLPFPNLLIVFMYSSERT